MPSMFQFTSSQYPDRPAIIMAGSRDSLDLRQLEERATASPTTSVARPATHRPHRDLTENHLDMIVRWPPPKRCGFLLTGSTRSVGGRGRLHRRRLRCPPGGHIGHNSSLCTGIPGALPSRALAAIRHGTTRRAVRSFDEVVEKYPAIPGENERLGTPCSISSGTTGRPKAASSTARVSPAEQLVEQEMASGCSGCARGMNSCPPRAYSLPARNQASLSAAVGPPTS
jgi:fatty-acyl-CoA synthase/long-chain acyl-CoA synthetase